MLVDANILLYAVDESSPFHRQAADWLSSALNGSSRIGIPWQSIVAFLRISTHERASAHPLAPAEAVEIAQAWLNSAMVWSPTEGPTHGDLLTGLIDKYKLRGNLISDAHLAALAIEHGLQLCSADTDFARFTELAWVNPVAAG
jgi:hypothetical protein